ncbi:TPA: hypothetical protein ACH3X3_000041 [Trebouxia sp. C0006]
MMYTSVKKAFKNDDLRLKLTNNTLVDRGEVVSELCLQVYDITQEGLDPLDPNAVKWKHIYASHTVL